MRLDIYHFVQFAGADDLSAIKSTLAQVTQLLEKTMDKLTLFLQQQKAYNDSLTASLDGIKGDVTGLTAKVEALKATIAEPTAEQSALMTELTEQGAALVSKFADVDALTPPETPAETTETPAVPAPGATEAPPA